MQYSGDAAAPLLARIYRPVGARGPLPVLIDVHCGAWSLFDRTGDMYFDHALAACGMLVVALDFRQAPIPYPAAVADVVAGIRFVKANAAPLDALPAPLGLIGGSSGGHLLLLAALRPNAPEYRSARFVGEGEPAPVRVDYALPLWPVADPLARYRYLLDRIAAPRASAERFFQPERLRDAHLAFFGDEATMARASVPRLVADGEAEHLPPIWVAHPELDENVTRSMSEALVDTYRRAGGRAELVYFDGVGHSFANFPGPDADRCIAAMKPFIAAQLRT
ncbi:MAG: alpha/beta hydrolase [Deltaproteobacteria bacterium]|nr:alpha/beta hydrolase [Deltaproteobacteria bacterium]